MPAKMPLTPPVVSKRASSLLKEAVDEPVVLGTMRRVEAPLAVTAGGVGVPMHVEESSTVQRDKATPSNALLDLPPPMPLRLDVRDLWVGVPESKAISYVYSRPCDESELLCDIGLGLANIESWLPKRLERPQGKSSDAAELEKGEQPKERKKWILKGAHCECVPGQVMAM